MVVDTAVPTIRKLLIYGTLELESHMDHVLNITYVMIQGAQANLIIGWEDRPMFSHVIISLQGNWKTPDIVLPDGPVLGSKAIGRSAVKIYRLQELFG